VGAAFVVSLREGIEAALLVSIILAYLRQVDAASRSRTVWWGTGLAVAVSVAIGAVIFAVGAEFEGTAEQLFEGLVTLTAVGVLTWMIFWMRSQGSRIKGQLQHKVDTALLAGGFALGALAFVAVLREGIETALFIFAAAEGTAVEVGNVGAQLLGAFLGLGLAVVLAVLLYRRAIHLDLRTFFRVTGLALIVVAAGLFAFSLHELQEAGWLPFLTGTAFDVSATLPDDSGLGGVVRSLVGYNAAPSWLEVVGWASYLIAVGGLFVRGTRGSTSSPRAPAASERAASERASH
jgi:high-affinity iron transporter